ncbi:MAG TPA: DUF4192 domain-containing protein [Pseudonocardiaceae bacterium]|nr:DUF4192 domain-containing protein [Pseudonocardiaceae bacterium]
MALTQHPHITLEHPGDLIASIPALLGFHPLDSLVVFGLRGPRATDLTLVLRSDLPPPSRARELAHTLLLPLAQQGAVGIALVVVGGQGRCPDDDLPHRELLARCEIAFVDNGIPVVHQLWTPGTVAGHRWRCYDESDCSGVLPDPGGTDLASHAAETGLPVYASRESIVATLTPEPLDVLARRSASLDRFADAAEPVVDAPDPPQAKLDAVRSAIEAAVTAEPELSDDDVIQLADALADHRIRDVCLDFDRLPDIGAAERLWTALARATPAPERAEPACLLAYSAYVRGDGVLAGIALAEAEEADPGHRLSGLLRGALSIGLSPSKLRVAGVRAATFAREALAEEPS